MSSESSTGVFSGESYVPQNDYSAPPAPPRPNATGSINVKNYLKNLEDRLFSTNSRNPNFRWAFRSIVILSAESFTVPSMRPLSIASALQNAVTKYDAKIAVVTLLRAHGIPEEALVESFILKSKEDLYLALKAEQARLAHADTFENAKFW